MSRMRLIAVLSLAYVAGCEGTTEDAPEEQAPEPAAEAGTDTAERALTLCQFETFEVEVTQGPNAGLKVKGPLYAVEEQPTGRLAGVLETDDGVIDWTGHYRADGRISLSFQVGDDVIAGVGPIAGSFCGGEAPVEGIAFGPTMAEDNAAEGTDLGHWLMFSPAQVYVYQDPTLTAGTEPAEGTNLTIGGGVVTRNHCTGCGGTISNGTCQLPPADNVGTQQAAQMCISPLIRGSGSVLGALIQFFDL